MSSPNFIVAVPLMAIVAAGTFNDLRERRIPNGLSLGGAALGVLANTVQYGSTGAALAFTGWILCLLCFLPLYVSAGTAAGDVKLMAMVGAFLGPLNGFLACMLTLVAGASIAALFMAWRTYVVPSADSGSSRAIEKVPYAAAIAVGTTMAVLQPAWLTGLVGWE